jgi:hypothetical protein
MSNSGISAVLPQLQALIATKLRQPDVSAQAATVKTVGATTDQIAATLSSISSGINIQA